MKLYTKEEVIDKIRQICNSGWKKSVKTTVNTRNDGAVGNTLERLLEIEENNLPIPNAGEWELKGQRKNSVSLITLKHIEPSPRAAKVVPGILLPLYGWRHAQAGKKYPETEMSFRSTTGALSYTSRGFRILVDKVSRKIRFTFDALAANGSDPEIEKWLASVNERVGLGLISPKPFWGFDDLNYAIGSKMVNCFYVIADAKVEKRHEFFKYEELYLLSGFSFDKLINCIEKGHVLIDFDARTGHNHGTKFRIRQGHWPDLFTSVKKVI